MLRIHLISKWNFIQNFHNCLPWRASYSSGANICRFKKSQKEDELLTKFDLRGENVVSPSPSIDWYHNDNNTLNKYNNPKFTFSVIFISFYWQNIQKDIFLHLNQKYFLCSIRDFSCIHSSREVSRNDTYRFQFFEFLLRIFSHRRWHDATITYPSWLSIYRQCR